MESTRLDSIREEYGIKCIALRSVASALPEPSTRAKVPSILPRELTNESPLFCVQAAPYCPYDARRDVTAVTCPSI